jgi:DNA-binding MarR family transcriptional regulator
MTTRREIRSNCLNLLVRRFGRDVTRAYDRAFACVGLTSGQFSILAMLSEDPVPGLAEIAELLGMDRTTLLAALKPLERRGLVRSEEDPADKRRRPVTLTEQGRAVFESAVPVWAQAQRELEARFGAGRIRALRRVLSD